LLAGAAYRLAHGGAPASEARDVAERALADGLLVEEEPAGSLGTLLALYALGVGDRLEPVDRYSQEALSRARVAGSVPGYVRVSSLRAWLALWRGDVATSLAEARNAQAVADLNDGGGWMPHTLAYLVDALVAVGAYDEAAGELERRGLLGELPVVWPINWLLYSRGALRLEMGLLREGLADMIELSRRQAAWGNTTDVILPWRVRAATACVALGECEQALEIARDDVAAATNWGTDRARGVALRGLGIAEGGAHGIATLRESARVLEQSPAVLEHAETLLALGAALRRSNHRAEARPVLREAMDHAARCGAASIVERTRTELLATGARPRRIELTGAEALTASERRVALLAADGHGNRAIAQSLFVTINTVETHLRHAYQKLGIGSRQELGAALASQNFTVAP
jgi:DNA-binding CsgD family transcriptional regulator